MITTLRTGALALAINAQYKFSATDKKLIIKLTAAANHKLYGDVKIALTEVDIINIKKKDGNVVANYFNNTFKFTRTSATELEYSEEIESGIDISETFIDLPPDGETTVEAEIVNSFFDLKAGKYDFFLLDTADSVFSTSKIGIKYLNVGGSGVAGIESLFDQFGTGPFLSMNNQTLTFSYDARISISGDVSGTTNIPLVING